MKKFQSNLFESDHRQYKGHGQSKFWVHLKTMSCSLPGSSVHGILQARILEWVAISLSRGSSQSRDQIQVSCIASRFLTIWAIREAPSDVWLEANPESLGGTVSQPFKHRVELDVSQHLTSFRGTVWMKSFSRHGRGHPRRMSHWWKAVVKKVL